MKILLVAINAKYVHSNLAVYNLKAYAKSQLNIDSVEIELAEYTINQYTEDIIREIYRKKADMVAFSCYIWNIEYVKEVAEELKKISPKIAVWLGGPEVSYCAEEFLKRELYTDGIMVGEGEETFCELVSNIQKREYQDIKGLVYRTKEGTIETTDVRRVMELDKVPFIYGDMSLFEHKIIYYESSRGCPFSCSYCLSSIDKKLRFRSLELVKAELGIFLEKKVPQVKFVDRTFNCSHEHAWEIWSYIKENDNGITNFHFEVAADILSDEEIQLIGSMRPGLIQLEIGVQSTNQATIEEIRRVMDFEEVKDKVEQLKEKQNVHLHLDLIAGLPFEDYETFIRSFNNVYGVKPEQLQLGFLKVLHGSYMKQNESQYGLVYQTKPPYEIYYNKWISYEEMLRLKSVEEMVEIFYNSGQFSNTLERLELHYKTPFAMYEKLAEFYEEQGLHTRKHSRIAKYEFLYEFLQKEKMSELEAFYDCLMLDLYLREKVKTRPKFAKEYQVNKELVRKFFEEEEETHQTLLGYDAFDKRQMSKMTHVECIGKAHILFDYKNRDKLTNGASTYCIE